MGVEKSCRLWSPVVMAELKNPRNVSARKVYLLEEETRRFEDLKVKIKNCGAYRRGVAIDAEFNLEILVLLEDQRDMRLFSRQETIRERLSWTDFTTSFKDTRLDLILDLHELEWDGELQGKELRIDFAFSYQILAVRSQPVMVLLEEQDSGCPAENIEEDLLQQLQLEIVQAEEEKLELKRKIRCYETDIRSLKRGVLKAETRNLSLYSEVHRHQQVIDQLRQTLGDKEAILRRYQQQVHVLNPVHAQGQLNQGDNNNLGGIIKRLFQNNI